MSQDRSTETNVTSTLIEIFKSLLSTADVHEDSDFFELGGTSVLAMHLAAIAEDEFGVAVQVHTIFEFPSPASLATVIRINEADSGRLGTGTIGDDSIQATPGAHISSADRGSTVNFTPTHQQEQLWLTEKVDPRSSAAYWLEFTVRISAKPLDIARLTSAWNTVVTSSPNLQTCFSERDGALNAEKGSAAELTLAPLSSFYANSIRDAEAQIAAEFRNSKLSIVQNQLLRAAGVYFDNEASIVVVCHHALVDAASVENLVRRLSVAYDLELSGLESDTVHSNWSRQDNLSRLREPLPQFRIRNAADALRGAAAPAGVRELSDNRGRDFDSIAFEHTIDGQVLQSIRRASAKDKSTIFSSLFTLSSFVLSRASVETDVTVGVPFLNRGSSDELEALGFFANVVPVRVRFDDEAIALSDAMSQTWKVLGRAAEHQDVPFPVLVNQLGANREWGANPLFRFMVGHHDRIPYLAINDAVWSVGDIAPSTAQFDVQVEFEESPDSIVASWRFDRGLITADAARAITHAFGHLLVNLDEYRKLTIDEVALQLSRPIELLADAADEVRSSALGPTSLLSATWLRVDRALDAVKTHVSGPVIVYGGVPDIATQQLLLETSDGLFHGFISGGRAAVARYVRPDTLQVSPAEAEALVTDRNGRPVLQGVVGEIRIAPQPAFELPLPEDVLEAWSAFGERYEGSLLARGRFQLRREQDASGYHAAPALELQIRDKLSLAGLPTSAVGIVSGQTIGDIRGVLVHAGPQLARQILDLLDGLVDSELVEILSKPLEFDYLGRTTSRLSRDRKEISAPPGYLDVAVASWKQVLGTEPSDTETSFFSDGGSSLTAIQLLSSLRKNGYELSMRDLYLSPSAMGVASHLSPTTPEGWAGPVAGSARRAWESQSNVD